MDPMVKALSVWALLLLFAALHPFVKVWFPYDERNR
jgi:hypothetical protein